MSKTLNRSRIWCSGLSVIDAYYCQNLAKAVLIRAASLRIGLFFWGGALFTVLGALSEHNAQKIIWKISGVSRFEPRTAGWDSRMLPKDNMVRRPYSISELCPLSYNKSELMLLNRLTWPGSLGLRFCRSNVVPKTPPLLRPPLMMMSICFLLWGR